MIAISSDGLHWQRLNLIMSDSADVPDALVGPDRNVYVYFQGLWTHTRDGIMVGISANGIDNWRFYQVVIPGTQTWPGHPCDPDIIFRNDTFRLYFTGDPIGDRNPETYSAISLDGLNFTLEEGVRFQIPGSLVLDPSLLWTGDTLQYFAGGAPPGENWHAHSSDGLLFFPRPNFSIESLMMANGISLPQGGYRFYGFNNNPNSSGIRSIFSLDGENWVLEPGYRLQIDSTNGLESRYVKDPAVILKDSIFIMYYVTRKPMGGIEGSGQLPTYSSIKIFPNPANSIVQFWVLSFLVKKVNIYNSEGRLIRTFSHKREIIWDGKDENGQKVRSGLYWLIGQNDKTIIKKKFIFLIN
ncbi:MAG: T9SS type A sorting domain-containing protein [candidate division WOR-3 bacterium]